jgi:D-3-phosphoglycerate dehydrogenase
MKVLACDGIHEDGLAMFRDAGWTVEISDPIKDPVKLAAALEGVDALLVRSATQVTAEAIDAAKQLKVIGRAGAGVDTIDVDAATAKGIAVMNAPDGNTLAAAEHAVSLLFALARHVPKADAGMKAGQWPKAGLTGFELEGKKLGVIGLGRIGSTVARKAQGVGMDVAAYDPFLPASAAGKGSVPLKTLDELLAWADIVTLHIPRTKDTTNLLSEERMRQMKKGAYLINAARGGLIDEDALRTLLDEGHLAGAALDTFATEPLPADSPLRIHQRSAAGGQHHSCAADRRFRRHRRGRRLRQPTAAYRRSRARSRAVDAADVGARSPRRAFGARADAIGDHLRRSHRSPGYASAHSPAGGRVARHRVGSRHAGERVAGSGRARTYGRRNRRRRRRWF